MSQVGDFEAQDIQKMVTRILRDLGDPEPPLSLAHVRELLRLDRQFYRKDDPATLDEVIHKMKMAGKQILARPTLLATAIQKANLSALWIPDSKRILIDQNLPKLKWRWIEGHEISHSFIPWHEKFLFGDTSFTLDPACHAMVEAEANYGAARLLFLQDRFANEARELELNFENIRKLAKNYGNTITSTLWRIVEDREPEKPVFGMIGAHPHFPDDVKPSDSDALWKHFIRSNAFRDQFSNVTPEDVFGLIARHAMRRRNGPIVDAEDILPDVDGELYDFRIESFSNSHALLTFGAALRKCPTTVSVAK